MLNSVEPAAVHLAWKLGQEIALIDLREEFAFADAHPLFAACIPLSRIEPDIHDLLPRSDVSIVLYDDGEGLVASGLEKLRRFGFTSVAVLEGGLAGWRNAGLELFADVNSPSKAFGELVEHRKGTPYVTATDLHDRLARKDNLVVLDARRFDEYQTMSIPGSVSVPGAELVLRARELAPDADTAIVVNCAGRTRSIIGAQSLINAHLPNPVMALRNGTIGWSLEDQALETGQDRTYAAGTADHEREALERARAVSYSAGVRTLGIADIAGAMDAGRTVYRFDVRAREEHIAGHPAGFRHVPGGQLVQEIDMVAPVRGARILLYDDQGSRSHMTGSWLAQMGWNVFVVHEADPSSRVSGAEPGRRVDAPECRTIGVDALLALPERTRLLVDLSPSTQHRKRHIPGAKFIMRGRLALDLPALAADDVLVLISADDELARHAASEAARATAAQVVVLEGGTASWIAAGHPLETGAAGSLSPFEDVYRRPYEGTDNPRAKMQAYLEWEYGLVDQLERDGSHGFTVV